MNVVPFDCSKLQVLKHQVAGCHNGTLSKMLTDSEGRIYKPYKKVSNPTYEQKSTSDELRPVSLNELQFYRLINSPETSDDFKALRKLTPNFYETSQSDHLVLSDITGDMTHPCVMDIKIGQCRNYPGRDKEKLVQDQKKYPSLRHVGFCVAGLRLQTCKGEELQHLTPPTTRKFTLSQVHNYLRMFFHSNSPAGIELKEKFLQELRKINSWMMNQNSVILRGSSLLFAYDAEQFCSCEEHCEEENAKESKRETFKNSEINADEHTPQLEQGTSHLQNYESPNPKRRRVEADKNVQSDDGEEIQQQIEDVRKERQKARVKMIDFAHVFYSNGEKDDNYLYGINHLIKFIEIDQ